LSPLSPAAQAAAADTKAAAAADTKAAATAANDYCGGQCSDILPPGQNGNATLAQILLNQAFGSMPENASNQLGPYNNLAKGYTGLTNTTINTFFNDASFGVASDQVASTLKPAGRTDVTIPGTRFFSPVVVCIPGGRRPAADEWFFGASAYLFVLYLCPPGAAPPSRGLKPAAGTATSPVSAPLTRRRTRLHLLASLNARQAAGTW
jgi:hypothetical protein